MSVDTALPHTRRHAVLTGLHAAWQIPEMLDWNHDSVPPPCAGAKLFYLSGMRHGKYLKREVLNLGRFISVMKFRPLSWRAAHGYLASALPAHLPKGRLSSWQTFGCCNARVQS